MSVARMSCWDKHLLPCSLKVDLNTAFELVKALIVD